MGCLGSKHSDLSEHTTAVLSRYHLTAAHITKTYSLFIKIQSKHNRDKTPLQLKLAGNRPVIHFHDLRHTFAIPPSLLSSHLLDLVVCEKDGELSFPEFLELTTVVCLMSREQLLSFGYHAFAVNEADELHLSDFVSGLTELKDVYPRIINGADIPVSKLGLLAQTTVDTLLTPHSGSATSAAATPPTPHHLTLSTFRQLMLNQPWFVDILSQIQDQLQRRTRSAREWNSHLLSLKSKEKGVLAAIDDIVRRRTPGSKKMRTDAATAKHVRRQSTVHQRAMDRIGRRQSSVLPEIGMHELKQQMAQLAEEEKEDTEPGGEHQPGNESSRSGRGDSGTHHKSALRHPSRHALTVKRKGSFSQQRDEPVIPAGSPSVSGRNNSHRRNHTAGMEDSPLSRVRLGLGTEAADDGTGVRGLRQQSLSHTIGSARMRNGRSSVDIGVMDRVQQQRLHMLRRNSTGNSDEGRETEHGGRRDSVGTDNSREAEEHKEAAPSQPTPFDALQPVVHAARESSRSQAGRERVSVDSTDSSLFRSRTNSGLTRVHERVSREDVIDHTSDDTLSPSVKSHPSSPPSRDRHLLAAVGASSTTLHKTAASTSFSRSEAVDGDAMAGAVRAREKLSGPAQSEASPPAASRPLHAALDEQDDQLTRLQAITTQKKLSVSTMHRKSSVARANTDDPSSSDSDVVDVPPRRRSSVMRDSGAVTRSSPHGASRVIGEAQVLSSNSTSPASVPREVVRVRNDSVSREEEAPTLLHRGSVSREHHSPVHSEPYRKELLHDSHSKYGSSPNLRPDRSSTSGSYSYPQAALQHTRSVPPPSSSHHTASPLQPGSLRPSISSLSASPYPVASRQSSISVPVVQHMAGPWDGSGMLSTGSLSMVGVDMAGGLYRSSVSGLQGGVVGGPAMAAMYGFAPAKMSLSASPQPMSRQVHY